MATKDEVAEAERAAQLALFKRIAAAAPGTTRFDQIQSLSRSFRYASGGAQPSEGPAAASE